MCIYIYIHIVFQRYSNKLATSLQERPFLNSHEINKNRAHYSNGTAPGDGNLELTRSIWGVGYNFTNYN